MSQETPSTPPEQPPVENSERDERLLVEIEGFIAELKGLETEESPHALIESVKQLIKKFSTLKEKADINDVSDLYASLDFSLDQAVKRDDLTSLSKVRLKTQIGVFQNSNPSFHEPAPAVLQEETESNQALETPDKEEAPPALSEKQKLESYIDDLRLESDALAALVARIKLQLGQAGLNLANSSYVELLQREKAARDLKLEIGRQIDFTSGTLSPKEQVFLKQSLAIATPALSTAKKFRQSELIPQVFKFAEIDGLNNYIENNAELRAGELDPEEATKATVNDRGINLIRLVNVKIGGLEQALSEDILADGDLKLVTQKLKKLRASLVILEKAKQLFQETAQLTRFEKRVEQLNYEINSILAIDLNTAKGNSNLTAGFEHQQAELKRQVGFATRVNLLINATEAGCENNQKVEARIKEIVAKIEEAKEHIARAIKATKERSETEVSAEALKKEYAEIRKELLIQLWKIETVEPVGTFLAESWDNIQEKHLRPLERAALQLQDLGSPEYVGDADKVGEEVSNSKMLFYQFETFKPATLAKIRKPIPGISLILSSNAPLEPKHVAWLMTDGLMEEKFGDVSNLKLLERHVNRVSLKQGADSGLQFEETEIIPTVMTELMREIDKVYLSGGDLGNGSKINVTEIHESYGILVDHLQDFAESLRIPAEQSLRVATKAFRLHWVFTLHQSYLVPESSPKVSDNFFYMYRWHRYFLKYVRGQTDQWLNEITNRTFGMTGVNYYSEKEWQKLRDGLRFTNTNQYADTALLADLQSDLNPRQVKRMPLLFFDKEWEKKKFKNMANLRREKKGFSDYSWISQPLFQLRSRMYAGSESLANDSSERDYEAAVPKYAREDEGYTIATPLQSWPLKKTNAEGQSEIVRFKIKQGDSIVPSFEDGEVATLDSALRTDQDEYLYEEIASQLLYLKPGELLGYFQDLESGPFQVLSNIWKADVKSVVGTALSPKGLNGLKKIYHYAVPFLPWIGPEIKSGSSEGKRLMKAAENQLTLLIAIAVLNYKIQEDAWGRREITKQLDQWRFEDQVFDEEDWEFLFAVTYKAKRMGIAARSAAKGVQSQIEKKLGFE